MVGAIADNFHEGSRSEYLAQYVFASFGTAAAVPHPEDHGIDLYCTLTERKGSLAWPVAYFSVQVKSTMAPWIFDNEDSVKWIVRYPLPLFLCVVDKGAGRIRVYHTFPRFYAWSSPTPLSSLKLTPAEDRKGKITDWSGGTDFTLSAPILDMSLEEVLKDEEHRLASDVLRFWISIELENIRRINAGIYQFGMPLHYEPNSIPAQCGWGIHGAIRALEMNTVKEHVKECMAYLTDQLHEAGDLGGATRGALFLRHLFRDDLDANMRIFSVYTDINKALSSDQGSIYSGVDYLSTIIDGEFSKAKNVGERST